MCDQKNTHTYIFLCNHDHNHQKNFSLLPVERVCVHAVCMKVCIVYGVCVCMHACAVHGICCVEGEDTHVYSGAGMVRVRVVYFICRSRISLNCLLACGQSLVRGGRVATPSSNCAHRKHPEAVGGVVDSAVSSLSFVAKRNDAKRTCP